MPEESYLKNLIEDTYLKIRVIDTDEDGYVKDAKILGEEHKNVSDFTLAIVYLLFKGDNIISFKHMKFLNDIGIIISLPNEKESEKYPSVRLIANTDKGKFKIY